MIIYINNLNTLQLLILWRNIGFSKLMIFSFFLALRIIFHRNKTLNTGCCMLTIVFFSRQFLELTGDVFICWSVSNIYVNKSTFRHLWGFWRTHLWYWTFLSKYKTDDIDFWKMQNLHSHFRYSAICAWLHTATAATFRWRN